MCSELDDTTVPSGRPPVLEDKHISFEQGTTDTMSESEDDDIGSEELMCNENIDVNDKESDDSDDEELTNRVFPQQRFSPVHFTARRSQTPDIGKIRYSPVEFPVKRAVTPNMYEQMIKSSDISSSSKPPSKMIDFGFRAPKGLPHSVKSTDKNESSSSLSGNFLRPKQPMGKNHSPGLTVSGNFQPTGSVFRPSQPSSSNGSSKLTSSVCESPSKAVVSSSDVSHSSFSQPALFPSHFTKFSPNAHISSANNLANNAPLGLQAKSPATSYKGNSQGGLPLGTSQNVKLMDSAPASMVPFPGQNDTSRASSGNLTSRPLTGYQVPSAVTMSSHATWSGAPVSSSLAPLTVSVATHTAPPFHQPIKSTAVLSPGAKGLQLKPIAPLLSPSLVATSPSGLHSGEKTSARVLLAKKPAPLSGSVRTAGKWNMMVDAKQAFPSHGGAGYYNANPVVLNANHGVMSPLLQSPPRSRQVPSPRTAHGVNTGVAVRPAPLSPRLATSNTSQLSPKGGKFFPEPYPQTEKVVTPSTSCSSSREASHTVTTNSVRQPTKPQQAMFEHNLSCPVDTQTSQPVADGGDYKGLSGESKSHVNSKTILKRYIADGMEE